MTSNSIQRTESQAPGAQARTPPRPTATPRADVWETPEAAHLAVELPGVSTDGLDLQIERDHLTLTATPDVGTPDGRELRAEWRPATFQRTFLLTDDADRDGIEAHLRHGLLQVRIPRRPEKQPRSVPVRVTAD